MHGTVTLAKHPALDLAAVQNYVRDNPGIAIDYLAALVKDNALRQQESGGRLFFRQAADLFSGRARRESRLYQTNLNASRMPLVGHVLACSDPILNSLLKNSEQHLFVSRSLGAWPGLRFGDGDDKQSSLAAEMNLSGVMGAPVLIALKHKDTQRARQQDGCACGCAAISAAAADIRAWSTKQAVTVPHVENSLHLWTNRMAVGLRAEAIAFAASRGLANPDHRLFTQYVTEAFVNDTVRRMKELDAMHARHGTPRRTVIGAIVDQRSGDLWVKSGDAYRPYQPRASLAAIERNLFRIAEGKTPRRNAPAIGLQAAGSICG